MAQAKFFGLLTLGKEKFRALRRGDSGDNSALACEQCGTCLSACPNEIPIIEQLEEAVQLLRE